MLRKGNPVILLFEGLGKHFQCGGKILIDQVTKDRRIVHKSIDFSGADGLKALFHRYKPLKGNPGFRQISGTGGIGEGPHANIQQILGTLNHRPQFYSL